jgi:GAF domain-containing protein
MDPIRVPRAVKVQPTAPITARLDRTERFTADAFAQLAVELHCAPSVEETVEAVLEFALQAENCTHAGLALAVRGHRAELGGATDPVIEQIYQLQIDADDGPMLTAFRGRATLYIPDTTTETRWPAWRDKILETGIRSVLHVPLTAARETVGVLSLFNTAPQAFDADDEAIAYILGRHASIAVANARQDATMTQAIDARKVVGIAMGILMERYDLDGDQAFAVLRRYSQDTNTKLREVAQQLIDTRKLPGDSRE